MIAELVAVKGIGEWSAHMFLMFQLERPDILPVGDLGIRKMVQRHYGLAELPGAAEIERIAEPWRPYRTIASWYLWRGVDVPKPASAEKAETGKANSQRSKGGR